VESQVRANTETSATNAPGPAAAYSRKQTAAPAMAPEKLTPRTQRPRAVNITVTMPAVQSGRAKTRSAKVATVRVRWGTREILADSRAGWQVPRLILLSMGLQPAPPQCIVLSLWVTGATFVHQTVGCSLNSRSNAPGAMAGSGARSQLQVKLWQPRSGLVI
jgi:hypothetical protein